MIQDGQANPGFFNDNAADEDGFGQRMYNRRSKRLDYCRLYTAGTGRRLHRRFTDAGYVIMGKMIEFVLHNGVDPSTGKLMGLQTGDPREFKNIEEFKDALKKQHPSSL